jgi:two-component system CheB/CheR fusion protein
VSKPFSIVGIGASAGGFEAIWEFFAHIPPRPNLAFVVLQHLQRDHLSVAHELLARYTPLPVYRAHHGQVVAVNSIYQLPENKMMTIQNGRLLLRERTAEEVNNRAVDIFFHSLAQDQKQKAVGIVLSGMGSDGASGVQAIHQQGGIVLVQEPHSTPYQGMPQSAIDQDHPDLILPPAQLARALLELVQSQPSVR